MSTHPRPLWGRQVAATLTALVAAGSALVATGATAVGAAGAGPEPCEVPCTSSARIPSLIRLYINYEDHGPSAETGYYATGEVKPWPVSEIRPETACKLQSREVHVFRKDANKDELVTTTPTFWESGSEHWRDPVKLAPGTYYAEVDDFRLQPLNPFNTSVCEAARSSEMTRP